MLNEVMGGQLIQYIIVRREDAQSHPEEKTYKEATRQGESGW